MLLRDNKLGDFTDKHTGGNDYGYDANGNLVTDLNKRINGSTGLNLTSGGAIQYNHLNLPARITVKQDDGTTFKGTIQYIYDAAGNKLQKITTDQSTSGKTITTTTSYMAGFVYESKVTSPANDPDDDYTNRLQFAGQEEGRLRYTAANTLVTPNIPESWHFDYFIKDHLGNIRMVLAEAEETSAYPAATLEDSRVATEQQLYDIASGRIESLPTPVKNGHPSLEEKAYRVRGVTGEKTGLGIVLKVMAGDVIAFKAESYYAPPPGGNPGSTDPLPVSSLLDAFVAGLAEAGKAGVSGSELLSVTSLANAVSAFLTDPDRTPASAAPKAYLNYLLFDDQLNSVDGGFDKADQGSGNGYKLHTEFLNNPVEVTKNGYLYIYTSNESDLKVLFDNLQVTDQKGRLLEETHYYPFGLTMAGISSKALGKLENKYKWNKGSELQNKEFSDGSGLEMYATNLRSLDPQLGRWWQIDPKASGSESPYASMGNNPIRFNDPLGDTIRDSQIRADKNLSKAYNTFLGSKAGKRFVKLYSPGGKYGSTTVEFKVGSKGASGNTKAFSINKEDGTSTELKVDKVYDGIDKVAKGDSKNSYLKFEVTLRSDDMSRSESQVDGGETILHETQHVRIDQQTLITNRAIAHPYFQHRDWMKPTSSQWYQERAGFYTENRQMWRADYERQRAQGKVKSESEYIQKKVNDFFN